MSEARVKTPIFMVSYPSVFAKKMTPSGKERYSIQMVFDKDSTDLTDLKKAAHQCAVNKWGADKSKWPKNMKSPFRDGDAEDKGDLLVNKFFINASTDYKPDVVDQSLQPILNEDEFYAGCFARASLVPFAYSTAGNAGVSFGLRNIQKVKDGDRIGGSVDAATEFESLGGNTPSHSTSNDSDFETANDMGF